MYENICWRCKARAKARARVKIFEAFLHFFPFSFLPFMRHFFVSYVSNSVRFFIHSLIHSFSPLLSSRFVHSFVRFGWDADLQVLSACFSFCAPIRSYAVHHKNINIVWIHMNVIYLITFCCWLLLFLLLCVAYCPLFHSDDSSNNDDDFVSARSLVCFG